MNLSLPVTVVLEGAVAIGFSTWHRKPVLPVFLTSLAVNLVTQSMLWIVLNLFFQRYLFILVISEILIILIESAALYGLRANRLTWPEALLLSLGMNLTSLVLGWFVPG